MKNPLPGCGFSKPVIDLPWKDDRIAAWKKYMGTCDIIRYTESKYELERLAKTCGMTAEGLQFAVSFPKTPDVINQFLRNDPSAEAIALFYNDEQATVWPHRSDHEYPYAEALNEISLCTTGKPLSTQEGREAVDLLSQTESLQVDKTVDVENEKNSLSHSYVSTADGRQKSSIFDEPLDIQQKSLDVRKTIRENIATLDKLYGVSAEEYERDSEDDPLLKVRVPFNRRHLLEGIDAECREFFLYPNDTFRDGDDEDEGESDSFFETWVLGLLMNSDDKPWQYFYDQVVTLVRHYATLPVLAPDPEIEEIVLLFNTFDKRLKEMTGRFEKIPGVDVEIGDNDDANILLKVRVPFNNNHLFDENEPERFVFKILSSDEVDVADDDEDDGEHSDEFEDWLSEVTSLEKVTTQQFYDKVVALAKRYATLPQLQENEE